MRRFILRSAQLSLLLVGALCVLAPRALAGGFVVLVHGSNPLPSISHADLKKALTGGTKQWRNGAVVQLGLIPSEAPETQHLASLVDMSTRQLIGRIQEEVFKGEMRRPTVLKSSQDCLGLAQSNPGALCVAAEGLSVPNEARVLRVR